MTNQTEETTATDTAEKIEEMRDTLESDGRDIRDLIAEFTNAKEVTLTEEGIWIQNPQAGHYMSEEDKNRFLEWAN